MKHSRDHVEIGGKDLRLVAGQQLESPAKARGTFPPPGIDPDACDVLDRDVVQEDSPRPPAAGGRRGRGREERRVREARNVRIACHQLRRRLDAPEELPQPERETHRAQMPHVKASPHEIEQRELDLDVFQPGLPLDVSVPAPQHERAEVNPPRDPGTGLAPIAGEPGGMFVDQAGEVILRPQEGRLSPPPERNRNAQHGGRRADGPRRSLLSQDASQRDSVHPPGWGAPMGTARIAPVIEGPSSVPNEQFRCPTDEGGAMRETLSPRRASGALVPSVAETPDGRAAPPRAQVSIGILLAGDQ